jgi:5-methylcytosine-specific restriction enzyme A
MKRRTRLQAKTPLRRSSPLLSKAEKRKPARRTGPDRTTRELVLERDSGCVLCGKGPYGLQVHHRKPRRMGGSGDPAINAPSNLVSLCAEDHAWVESSREEALDMGLLLHDHDDPREVPVVHKLYGSVFLLDEAPQDPANPNVKLPPVRPVPSWGGVA